jgi:hypothetical protein
MASEENPEVYTIWYTLDGKTWKPSNSDVTGISCGQFWLRPPIGTLSDMKKRGFRAKIVKYKISEE